MMAVKLHIHATRFAQITVIVGVMVMQGIAVAVVGGLIPLAIQIAALLLKLVIRQ